MLNKLFKDKSGAGAIEQTIILLIFVMLFCFVYDIILVAYKQYAISEAANTITRVIAVQGGVLSQKPVGYQDATGKTYKTRKQVVDSLSEYLLGMDANLKALEITNTRTNKKVDLMDNNSAIKIDYKDKFHIYIEYTYSWDLTQNIVPSLAKDAKAVVERYSVGEFNYDDR